MEDISIQITLTVEDIETLKQFAGEKDTSGIISHILHEYGSIAIRYMEKDDENYFWET